MPVKSFFRSAGFFCCGLVLPFANTNPLARPEGAPWPDLEREPSLWKCGNRAPLVLARFPSTVETVEVPPAAPEGIASRRPQAMHLQQTLQTILGLSPPL